MVDENNAPVGEQTDSAAAAVTAETKTEETKAPETENQKTEGQESTSAEGEKPDAAKTDADKDKAASDAAKVLAEQKERKKAERQERWNKLTRDRNEAIRRAEKAEAELAKRRESTKEPNPADFDDPAVHTAARVEHALDKRDMGRIEEQAKTDREQAVQANLEAFNLRAEEAREKYTDFDDVVTKPKSLPIERNTQAMVLEMEESAEVIYHLAKNPKEAERIDKLPERARLVELGKIASRISTAPPRVVTRAPEPVETVAGKAAGGASFNPNKASVEDYVAKRKAGWGG